MAEYTLKYINHRARYDAADFIAECERTYHAQVDQVAEEIAENSRQKPIVLINGPSSSGKTTTNDRIGRALEKRGIHAEMISMDDYSARSAAMTSRRTRKTACLTWKVRNVWICRC